MRPPRIPDAPRADAYIAERPETPATGPSPSLRWADHSVRSTAHSVLPASTSANRLAHSTRAADHSCDPVALDPRKSSLSHRPQIGATHWRGLPTSRALPFSPLSSY